jgi:polyketide synthase PksJ
MFMTNNKLSTKLNIQSLACQKLNLILSTSQTTKQHNITFHMPVVHPLSSTQKSLWFEWMKDPFTRASVLRYAYKLDGQVQVTSLERAVRSVVTKYPVFHIHMNEKSGVPYQQFGICPEGTIIKCIESTTDEEALQVLEQEANKPYHLYNEPLYRFVLLSVASTGSHYFLFGCHHIILDGESVTQVLREISELYVNYSSGETPSECHSIVDWLEYEKKVANEENGKSIQFWNEYMSNSSPMNFPEFPDPGDKDGDVVRLHLSEVLMEQVKKMSLSMNTTVFKFLQSVFQVLMYRYSQSSDIMTWYPKNIRPKGFKGVGHYVGLQPSRVFIGTQTTFTDIVRSVEESFYQSKSVLPCSMVPVSQKPDPSFIFGRTMFCYEDFQLGKDISVSSVMLYKYSTASHFAMTYDYVATGIELSLEYSVSKYSKYFMSQMLRHYSSLVQEACNRPDECVYLYHILDNQEEELFIKGINNTDSEYPKDRTLVQLFMEHVHERPDAIALIHKDIHVTYCELNSKANLFASYLDPIGVGEGKLVLIHLDRSIEWIVAVLAVLKVGAAYIPVDPTYPSYRIGVVLEDTSAHAVVTCKELQNNIPLEHREKIALVDNYEFKDTTPAKDWIPTTLNTLAVIIFTSGSTGKPKGVMIGQQAISRLVRNQNYVDSVPGDRIAHISNICFDVSTFEIFQSLLNGMTMIIYSKDTVLPTQHFADCLKRDRVCLLTIPTGLFDQMVVEDIDISFVEHVIVGGDKFNLNFAREFQSGLRKSPKRLCNGYGPAEATTYSTVFDIKDLRSGATTVPVGKTINNTQVYVLDENKRLSPIGTIGEFYCSGDGLGFGYFNNEALTNEKYFWHTFENGFTTKMYKSGDFARMLPDMNIELLGRKDHQVKIRGFRIELEEIEAAIRDIEYVDDIAIIIKMKDNQKYLVAHVVTKNKNLTNMTRQFRTYLSKTLPDYMIPSEFNLIDILPLTPNGKIDRRVLEAIQVTKPSARSKLQEINSIESILSSLWKDLLHLDDIHKSENVFQLGAHSLMLPQAKSLLPEHLKTRITIGDFYKYPTIQDMTLYLTGGDLQSPDEEFINQTTNSSEDIAIIGMAGRFPGANSIDQFWDNLNNGTESITFFSKEELSVRIPQNMLHNPDYVPACGVIDDLDCFDTELFGMTEREAIITDPQQRVLLEVAWEALESASCNSFRYNGRIGTFAGVGPNMYLAQVTNSALADSIDRHSLMIGNEKDYTSTRIAHKLNLKGPAITVQTACSTSLAAVHLACHSLKQGECDMALAGGVSFSDLNRSGYLYKDGSIFSKDGHCRAFDESATGTVVSQAAALVVLKPLSKAIHDGDVIYSVIKGSAMNNDGYDKGSFTAPSAKGQASVIRDAMKSANVEPSSITFVEAHGTGTKVGDPIEFEGLCSAFSGVTKNSVTISAVKTNIGHTDIASGVTGLIKASLSLYHRSLPATLHFQTPNKSIDLGSSPFTINKNRLDLSSISTPRAGVSSFGIGGTNVHVVLEGHMKDMADVSDKVTSWNILSISAQTRTALHNNCSNLSRFVECCNHSNLDNIAYSLHIGRKELPFRHTIVCNDLKDISKIMDTQTEQYSHVKDNNRPIMFMFPGQGSQYQGMGLELYRSELVFAETVDQCIEILKSQSELFSDSSAENLLDNERINDTNIAQIAIFVVEYSLFRLLSSWNIVPTALVGHSLGELTAACVSGMITLSDCLQLLVVRGQQLQTVKGSMLAVRASYEDLINIVDDNIDVAAINSDCSVVLSGSTESIDLIQSKLQERNIQSKLVNTSGAFHSRFIDQCIDPIERVLASITISPPTIPIISTATGRWFDEEISCTELSYWINQMRNTVQFSKAIKELANTNCFSNAILLEVGPSRVLSSFVQQHSIHNWNVVSTMSRERSKESYCVLEAIAGLWRLGVSIQWDKFYQNSQNKKVSLPTYSFEKKRYWIDSNTSDLNREEKKRTVEVILSEECSETEATIIGIWKKYLGYSTDIGIHDNFFELGGDSLVTSSMMYEIRKEFSVPIVFTDQNLTVHELANALDSFDEDSPVPETSSLVCMKKHNSTNSPIILMHHIGGDIASYNTLVKELPRTVYAFRANSIYGETPETSVYSLAKKYLAELEKMIDIHSNFILVGYSFGGLITLEMAQLLKARNIALPLLVIIDTPISTSLPQIMNENQFINIINKNHLVKSNTIINSESVDPNIVKTWMAHQQAMHEYVPENYSGKVVFFRATDYYDYLKDVSYPWLSLVSDLHISSIHATHHKIISEPTTLVENLLRYLETLRL